MASGDLTSSIHVKGRDETGQLLAALQTMVRDSSESISVRSNEVATGSADLSQCTEEQASGWNKRLPRWKS